MGRAGAVLALMLATSGALVTRAPDGRAEAVPSGGAWQSTGALDACQPATPSCSPRSPLFTATVLPSGMVLVAGGQDADSRALATAELYDPRSGSWRPTGSMAVAREGHTATLLASGRVLVAGGTTGSPGGPAETASAELYDPEHGNWTAAGSMSFRRTTHSATRLPDGRVLVAGGNLSRPVTELYDPATNTWSLAAALLQNRRNHGALLLPAGRVLVAGGDNFGVGGPTIPGGALRRSAELYDPAADAWTPTGALATTSGPSAGLFPLASGRILNADQGDRQADLYDPTTGAWVAATPLPASGGTLVVLRDGHLLDLGGYSPTPGAEGPPRLTTAELYDPAGGSWSEAATMAHPRAAAAAALLPAGPASLCGPGCGRVLVMDGSRDPAVSATAELYSPPGLAPSSGQGAAPAGGRLSTSGGGASSTPVMIAAGTVAVAALLLLAAGWRRRSRGR